MLSATICFLLRGDEICLGMKQAKFGAGKWNGFGGKIGDREEIADETPEEAIKREGEEEFDVKLKSVERVAQIRFDFPHNPTWDHYVHVFVCHDWEGEPKNSDEMHPKWFKLSEIPYDQMWQDDKIWLPLVLEGKKLQAHFIFADNENIGWQKVEVVNDLRPARTKEAI